MGELASTVGDPEKTRAEGAYCYLACKMYPFSSWQTEDRCMKTSIRKVALLTAALMTAALMTAAPATASDEKGKSSVLLPEWVTGAGSASKKEAPAFPRPFVLGQGQAAKSSAAVTPATANRGRRLTPADHYQDVWTRTRRQGLKPLGSSGSDGLAPLRPLGAAKKTSKIPPLPPLRLGPARR
jgi:hypothetical protein